MLFGGFGFLMTFLKRHGCSAIALTMMITVVVTEWSILCSGFTRMDSTFLIQIKFEE
jgi:ammonium transporter Rh